MSNTPQGPGWWAGSDGKWHPPEAAAPPAAPLGSLSRVQPLGQQAQRPPIQAFQRVTPSGSSSRTGALVAISAAVLMAVSAFLPWISNSSQSLGGSGTLNAFNLGNQGAFRINGEILLFFAVVIATAGIVRLSSGEAPWLTSFVAIFGGIVTIVMCLDQYLSHSAFSLLDGGSSVGYGLVVAAVGGFSAFVAGILLRRPG
jgi:hypothetical protein